MQSIFLYLISFLLFKTAITLWANEQRHLIVGVAAFHYLNGLTKVSPFNSFIVNMPYPPRPTARRKRYEIFD